MEQLLASSSFQEFYPSRSLNITSHNAPKTSAQSDSDNPRYCANFFLFAATLTGGEKALLSPVAGCCSCSQSDTTRPEQPATDNQPSKKRLDTVVESHAEGGENVHRTGAQHPNINSAPPDFYTGRYAANFSNVQHHDPKEPTLGGLEIMSDVISDTRATGMCTVHRMPFHADLQQAAEYKNESISGEITGDLELDLGMQGMSPGAL